MGGIESDGAPGDEYVGLAVIDMPGYRVLIKDELVEFQYVELAHDSWNYRATWVRPMRFKDAQYRTAPRPGVRGHRCPVPSGLATHVDILKKSGKGEMWRRT
jgi:hypothetical protein